MTVTVTVCVAVRVAIQVAVSVAVGVGMAMSMRVALRRSLRQLGCLRQRSCFVLRQLLLELLWLTIEDLVEQFDLSCLNCLAGHGCCERERLKERESHLISV